MTVVAYDGQELVTDSQMTMADMKLPAGGQKLFTPKEDEYWEINGVKVLAYGFAGGATAIPYVREMLQKGITYRSVLQPEIDLSFDALCVLENGSCYVISGHPARTGKQDVVCIPMDPPVAVGSGAPYAYSQMEIGKKGRAQAGVKAAIKLDISCGGDLQIFNLPPIPEVLSTRPAPPEVNIKEVGSKVGDMSIEQLTSLIKDITRDMHPLPSPPAEEESEKAPQLTH